MPLDLDRRTSMLRVAWEVFYTHVKNHVAAPSLILFVTQDIWNEGRRARILIGLESPTAAFLIGPRDVAQSL